jgi:acyl carrier protein
LKKYRRKENTGAIVKKDDHGPDSLAFVMLNFRFEDEFGPDIDKAVVLHEQEQELKKSLDKKTFPDVGIASVKPAVPDFIAGKYSENNTSDKNVLVF